MTMNDTLAAALSLILNAEKIGQKECRIKPMSKVIQKVLDVFNENGYTGKYEIVADGRGGALKLSLLGNINKCGAIKPRFSTEVDDFEKWEKRFLPAKNFGVLIISTSKGIMAHEQAKKQNVGGRLLAYCY